MNEVETRRNEYRLTQLTFRSSDPAAAMRAAAGWLEENSIKGYSDVFESARVSISPDSGKWSVILYVYLEVN